MTNIKETLRLHSLWLQNHKDGVRANLIGANLIGADLIGANLIGANLKEVKQDSETKWPYFQIPQEGSLIVWKKLSRNRVAKLEVPSQAKRTASLVGRKCRAEYVKVLDVFSQDGSLISCGVSLHTKEVSYLCGETIKPDSYDPNPLVECTNGIHFFLTREEAEKY